MRDPVQRFRDAIQSAGLVPPEVIEADGKLRRFGSNGKRGDDAGWYVLHGDGIPAGSFGDWRTGHSQAWRADIGRDLTPDEKAAHRHKVAAMQREREAEEARQRAEAAKKAAAIWNAATPAPSDHPYLARKGIKRHGVKLHNGALVIPMRSGGELCSLQFIGADGDKRFLTGGRVAGCYYAIGNPKGAAALAICEGVATGATIHEATGYPVAVAFNAGNLGAVASAMRERFPDLPLILCADDDWKTEGNPGMAKATQAAQAIGGKLAIPAFGTDRDPGMTDFNDMAVICGAEAVARAIAGAIEPPRSEPQPDQENASTADPAPLPKLIRASDVRSRPIAWLWHEWIAGGKLHVIGGAPGLAKTTIALAWAATITTAGRWPDGTPCREAGDVVIWSAEDSIADTLRPRLEAMGANLDRVHFVGGVPAADGGDRPFDPATDMRELMEAVCALPGVKLLIVDPIVSAVAGDSHKNAEVRRGLQPLVDFAEKIGAAVLGITHFSKGTGGRDPLERLTGSLAFGALARLVFGAAKLKDDDGSEYRALVRIKSNIGPDGGGFRYDVEHADIGGGIIGARVLWGEAIEGAARELLATADAIGDDGEGGTLADAKRFLAALLADGPMRASEVFKDADGAGFSKRSIQRAANGLGADRRKDGMRGGWVWTLPAKVTASPEDAEDARIKYLAPSAPSATPSLVEVEI